MVDVDEEARARRAARRRGSRAPCWPARASGCAAHAAWNSSVIVLVQEERAELRATARRPRPATAGCGCRPSSPWRGAARTPCRARPCTHHRDEARDARGAAAQRERHPAVLARPDLALHALRLPEERAGALAAVAGHHRHRRGRHVRHHHGLLQRDVDVLARAGALAREQRERDARRRLDAAVVVRHRQRAAQRARDRDRRCSAGCRSCAMTVRSEPRQPARGPGLPEGRERAQDEARVAGVRARPSRARVRRARPGASVSSTTSAPLGEPEEEVAAARAGRGRA